MLGDWPEPFGLVAIESMATGTPVIARRAGALTETIEHGVTGFLVDDVDEAALAVEQASPSWTGARSASARSSGSRRRGWSTSTSAPIARCSPRGRPPARLPSWHRPRTHARRRPSTGPAEDLDAGPRPGPDVARARLEAAAIDEAATEPLAGRRPATSSGSGRRPGPTRR